jgi:hypothetical protein
VASEVEYLLDWRGERGLQGGHPIKLALDFGITSGCCCRGVSAFAAARYL